MPLITSESIPKSMPAAVLEAPEKLTVKEIPVWDIEAYGDSDLVLIKVMAVGVCGSDFRYYKGENPWAQHTLGKFVPNPPNIVLGHEYAGVVVAVQSEKNQHLLGKRVAPVCSKVCGSCPECRSGRTRLCPVTVHLGHGQGWGERDYYPGAYAHYVPSWGSSCYEIKDSMPFEEAAMMDIIAVCIHVSEQGNIQTGRPVLTVGAGPAGNGVAQVALATGASHAVMLDLSPVAVHIGEKQGFATVLQTRGASKEDLRAQLRQLAPEGFGSVFDTVGTSESISLGLSVLGKAGTLVNLAIHDEPIAFNFMQLGSERKIVSSCNFEAGDYAKGLALMESGKIKASDWLTPTSLQALPGHFADVTKADAEKDIFKLVVNPWQ